MATDVPKVWAVPTCFTDPLIVDVHVGPSQYHPPPAGIIGG